MKKKILVILMTLIMALTLAACAANQQEEPPQESDESSTAEVETTITEEDINSVPVTENIILHEALLPVEQESNSKNSHPYYLWGDKDGEATYWVKTASDGQDMPLPAIDTVIYTLDKGTENWMELVEISYEDTDGVPQTLRQYRVYVAPIPAERPKA